MKENEAEKPKNFRESKLGYMGSMGSEFDGMFDDDSGANESNDPSIKSQDKNSKEL
jgi:hypothetical protein